MFFASPKGYKKLDVLAEKVKLELALHDQVKSRNN